MDAMERKDRPVAEGRSRRRLLKAVAVGGGALVLGPALGALPAAAEDEDGRICPPRKPYCEPPDRNRREWREVSLGTVTLGAILNLYVSAPLSARGTMTWTMSNTRTETIRSITEDNRQLTASGSINKWTPGRNQKFSIGGGADREQGQSTRITDAITTASTQTQSIQTVPTNGGYNTWEHTAFLMMAHPTLAVSTDILYRMPENTPIGSSDTFHYSFVDGGTIFPRSARELRDDPGTRDFIGPETADSILAQYPLTPDQTSGTALGLGAPRFGPPTAIAPGQPPFTFTRSMTGTTTHIEERSTRVTTRIKSGFELTLFGLPVISFQTQRSWTTVHTGVQEESNVQVVTTSGTLSSDLNHLNHIRDDFAFNTVLITDEGPLPANALTVSGIVTSRDGAPLAGAWVSMSAGGVDYQAVTDPSGRYVIRTARDVKPGRYPVVCAGVTATATLAAGSPARVDYHAVNPGRARVPRD